MKLRLTAGVKVAKGVQLPEWAYELWTYFLSELRKGRSIYARDFAEKKACKIYIGQFFKDRNIEIPLTHILLKEEDDWGGHADFRNKILMIKTDSKFLKDLEDYGVSFNTLENLRRTFFHELGHLLDKSIQHRGPKGLSYTEKETDEGASEQHAKFPVEWRAYITEIQGDLYDNARWAFEPDPTGETLSPVADYLSDNSIEWRRRQQYLPPEGRRYILEVFARDLIKDPDKYSKAQRIERVHPFKTLGQYVTVAVHLWEGKASPFSHFLMDQLYDIPDEVTDPLHMDIDWFNSRMDYLPDCYDRTNPRLLNAWIKQLNELIDRTPESAHILPCKPLEKYVVGLYLEEAKKKFPDILKVPFGPVPENFGRELIRFTDSFCNKYNVNYWQNPLEKAFNQACRELREQSAA